MKNKMTNTKENQNRDSMLKMERKRKTEKVTKRTKQEEKINRKAQEKNEQVKVQEKQKQDKTIIEKQVEKTAKKGTRRPRKKAKVLEEVRFRKSPLKIIPLGGLLEIGKNITVFEYEDEIVIVDCGLAFPTEDMLGVDLVVADTSYLEKNKDKIKALVITHGHEDHIGGIPYLLRQVNVPIYATRFTVGLIKNKLEEHNLLKSTKIYEVEQGTTVDFGKIKVEFIRTSHSIPDAVSFAIYTPVRNCYAYRRF